MNDIKVRLPGGLRTENRLERSVQFHPITGFIEQQLLDFYEKRDNPSDYVTEVLQVAIERIGERQPNREEISSLCVADRQYLMIQLSRLMEGDQVWKTHKCEICSSMFDISIDRSQLPIKEAGSTFPKAHVNLHGKDLKLQVPTGTSQKLVSNLSDEDAIRILLSSCLISVDGEKQQEDFVKRLGSDEISMIESALEKISPEVAVTVLIECPECCQEQVVPLDPYSVLEDGYSTLYHEIHSLALHYHWSESDILNLSRERRQLYLGLLDRARGMYGGQS